MCQASYWPLLYIIYFHSIFKRLKMSFEVSLTTIFLGWQVSTLSHLQTTSKKVHLMTHGTKSHAQHVQNCHEKKENIQMPCQSSLQGSRVKDTSTDRGKAQIHWAFRPRALSCGRLPSSQSPSLKEVSGPFQLFSGLSCFRK